MLVLLHAFPLSSRMWSRLTPLLDEQVRVIPVDLLGLGGGPAPETAPSMVAMADAVVDVLDEQDVATATICGLSTGGYVALALAQAHPERVAGLVLASTTCWVVEPDLPEDRQETAAELERSGSIESLLGSASDGLGDTALREQPDLEPFVRSIIAASDPAGVAWAARAIAAREDTSAVLSDLDRPVLLLFGAEDTETPPTRGEAMRDLRLSDGGSAPTRLEVIDSTGHLTALEQPARVAEVLLGWLAGAHD